MQRDRAERIRQARSSRAGDTGDTGGGGGGGGGSSRGADAGALSSTFPPPGSGREIPNEPLPQQQQLPPRKHSGSSAASGDDLLSRLEALKSQLSTQPADRQQSSAETELGRTRSEQERVRRQEAEAALQHERHKHTSMQDEIAGLRDQITALQGTRGAPPPLEPSDVRQPPSRSSAPPAARTASELKREMDDALERANRLSEERVSRQQEREQAEERERQARQAEDKAWTHVRFLVERDAKAHRESPQPGPAPAPRMQPASGLAPAPAPAAAAPVPARSSSRQQGDYGSSRSSKTASDDDKLARLLRELHSHESMYGKSHAKYADACYNVGLHHRAQGRVSEAQGFFQDAADIYGYLYGEDHDETVEARDCAAECQLASASTKKASSPASEYRPPPAATTGYRPSVAQYSDEDEGDDLESELRGGLDDRAYARNRSSGSPDAYTYGESSGTSQPFGGHGNSAWRSDVRAGSRIDAQDSQGVWYEGVVEDTRGDEWRIHYFGWPHTWDEWLSKDSPRLDALHTNTNPDGTSVGPDKEEQAGRPTSSTRKKEKARQGRTGGWSQDFTAESSLQDAYDDEDDDDLGREIGAGRSEQTYGSGRSARSAQIDAAGPDDVPPPSSSAFSAPRGDSMEPEQTHRRRETSSPPLRDGSVVEAKWSNGEWYPGVVGSSVKFGDGSVDCYTIRFDDGAVIDGLLPDAVRPVAQREPAPAPEPAPARADSRGGGSSSRRQQSDRRGGGGVGSGSRRGRDMDRPAAMEEYGDDGGRGDRGASGRTISPPTVGALPPATGLVDVDSIPVGSSSGGGMAGVSEYPDDGFAAGRTAGGGGGLSGSMGGSGGVDELVDEYADGPQEPLRPCRTCGRRFKESSLVKHEKVCGGLKQRKVFDSKAARVAGTDAAKFVGRSGSSGSASERSGGGRGGGGGSSRSSAAAGKNPKWKQQSNQLREAMKMARQVTQAQKDGVPLSELPMPAMQQDDADDGASQLRLCPSTFLFFFCMIWHAPASARWHPHSSALEARGSPS